MLDYPAGYPATGKIRPNPNDDGLCLTRQMYENAYCWMEVDK